jgi:hypothetical protein
MAEDSSTRARLVRKIHVDAYHLSGDTDRAVERLSSLLTLVAGRI